MRPRVAIRSCAPDPERGRLWGDTHFAAGFREALQRQGAEARVDTVATWDSEGANDVEVVVHLRGIHAGEPRSDRLDVLWVISHPEEVTDAELDGHDLVLASSSQFVQAASARTSTPVELFLQATDIRRFVPPRGQLRRVGSGVVVVANHRWPVRWPIRWLTELGRDFELYGARWGDTAEARRVRAWQVPNDELADLYATAAIVVADHEEGMARAGFVANRLFDVAAAGGFSVSDAGPGIGEVFGDLVPTYASRRELDEVLDRYLEDVDERERRADAAMAMVRSEHSFDVRAHRLLELLDL